ncbi:MAG: PIN domain-containing protein [Deltaproteobacteria bacterium]|nr:PIN domain-containing protein [Deltaproteobacteria bacterium]
MTTFVDTGVLFAAAVRRDARHQQARRLLVAIAAEHTFTTDHVLLETWMMIRLRAGWAAAMRFLGAVRSTPLAVETTSLADLERAQGIATAWEDQQFDLVDCTSFAVIERVGCGRAASFDRDFAVWRYGPKRSRALDVLS